jgi:hypothetical protein
MDNLIFQLGLYYGADFQGLGFFGNKESSSLYYPGLVADRS